MPSDDSVKTVGATGNSSDGMLHVHLTTTSAGTKGVTIALTHDGWSSRITADVADLARIERLLSVALDAVAAYNRQDAASIREKFAGKIGDEERFARLLPPPVRAAKEPA